MQYQSWLFYLIDPLHYNSRYEQFRHWWWEFGSRLRIPKLILNATGDQYSLPNASNWYFGELDAPKWLRYVPNTDHAFAQVDFDLDGQADTEWDFDNDGLADGGYGAMLLSALPWYASVLAGDPLPFYSWDLLEEGMLRVTTGSPETGSPAPTAVTLWTATSRTNDFRFDAAVNWDVAGGLDLPTWNHFPLQETEAESNLYMIKVTPDLVDFTAFFVELTYANGLVFTTEVTIIDPVSAFEIVPPTADFDVNNRAPAPGEQIQFSDLSSEGTFPLSRWLWDFGDGDISTSRNPSHIYAEPGSYTVTLTVTADDGTGAPADDTLIRVAFITVVNPAPTADFVATPRRVVADVEPVQFTDLSLRGEDNAPITAWLWDFGDGSAVSTEANPVHTYAEGGVYDVSLSITSDSGASDTALHIHAVHVVVPSSDMSAALYDYVSSEDLAYAYVPNFSAPSPGFTQHVLRMTSQEWRTEAEVTPVPWQHWLTIIEPDERGSDTALLIVSGGSNTREVPSTEYLNILVNFAIYTGSVTVVLEQIPSEPLVFTDEARTRSEDEIIAYTFDKFLGGYDLDAADGTWPLLLPMVKSAVRAMDTVQDYLAEHLEGRSVIVNDFVVTGASKRGWTTWLTAAYDAAQANPRVRAIAPMVIDVLSMDEQMSHHRRAYQNYDPNDEAHGMVGGYSAAVQDYAEFDVFDKLHTEGGQALMTIVDPYQFRDELTVPKLMINASGDEFFLPDAAQFYFYDLAEGPNYLSYIPNTGHGLETEGDTINALFAFYNAMVAGLPLPEFSWSYTDDNTLVLDTDDGPTAVTLWQAHNAEARDFREPILGPVWDDTELVDRGGGLYQATVPDPEEGWAAYFIQVKFDSPLLGVPYTFSTPIKVVPETYPEP